MRIITLIVSLLTAIVVIALLTKLLPPTAAAILLDINRSTFPFTVQNILWLAFFIGLGELSIRWRAGRLEASQIERGYLPEDWWRMPARHDQSILTLPEISQDDISEKFAQWTAIREKGQSDRSAPTPALAGTC